jgi:hypothetical protein
VENFYLNKAIERAAAREVALAVKEKAVAIDQRAFDDWAAAAPLSPGFRRGGGSTPLQLYIETYKALSAAGFRTANPDSGAGARAEAAAAGAQEAARAWQQMTAAQKAVWGRRLDAVQANYASEKAARAQERASPSPRKGASAAAKRRLRIASPAAVAPSDRPAAGGGGGPAETETTQIGSLAGGSSVSASALEMAGAGPPPHAPPVETTPTRHPSGSVGAMLTRVRRFSDSEDGAADAEGSTFDV